MSKANDVLAIITEIQQKSVSGAMAGTVYRLDSKSYILTKPLKLKVSGGSFVTFPKGTDIANKPGGTFAGKEQIVNSKENLTQIEKNSKITSK